MAVSKAYFFSPLEVLRAHGPDARTFLQGQTTVDLSSTGPGGACFGLFLDRKGKVTQEAALLCGGSEDFLMVRVRGDGNDLRQRLEAYLIMDELELEPLSYGAGLAVWGELQREVLAALGSDGLGEASFLREEGVLAFWGRGEFSAALLLLVDADRRADLWNSLGLLVSGVGAEVLGDGDMDRLAVENLAPRLGREIPGGEDLPQEWGMVDGLVSFNKGCYLGQEVMARIHSMGRVRKRPGRVRSDSFFEDLKLPAALFADGGKRVGELRGYVPDGAGGIGLALVSVSAPDLLYLGDGRGALRLEAADE